ncbi:tetratricopeptide repeat protein [Peribacillus acanthi]|uniref:tetratricopeptide repeat protein n=1 Tax=Peribacillus acanthi TaxID=2171554 RepID=UPI000D3E9A0A|nr:tetratricopeptide repeat protein [Peribacillus acanthi]
MGKDSNISQQAKILSFHPTGEYYFTKGLKAYYRRDLYKAKKYLERALELEPIEPMITCQLAIVCTDLGEYSYSNTLLQSIIEDLDPYMTECHYFLANNYAHLGMFKEAFKHANEYLDQEEDGEFSADAEDLLDLITFETDETEESLIEQDGLIFQQERAREYLEAGNFLKAIDVLKETITEYPDFWSAYNNLALAYFYLGEQEKAFKTLDDVLEKSPGNLHALCNLVVFYYYEQNGAKVEEYTDILEKIRPMLSEQQFKLGATFALVGKYDAAYKWLKQLYKKGFEGDGTFYYWLSSAAYHLGHETTARKAWRRVIELNPEKEGMEPWGELNIAVNGFEHHVPSILKRLESEFQEERLFAIFLLKHSMQRDKVVDQVAFGKHFSDLEKEYAAFVLHKKKKETGTPIDFSDQIAELLYRHHSPVGLLEAGLYLMWFSVFVEAMKQNIKLSNPAGWAAAIEYAWHRLRNEKKSQKEVAEKYYISSSTLQKYMKLVNSLLH